MNCELPTNEHNGQTQVQQPADGSGPNPPRKRFVPVVDIAETDQSLTLVADLPGVDEKGIDVTIEKNILTITGSVSPKVPEGFNLSYQEYGVGDYERAFTLPNEIDREGIQATVKDGVLRLTLPKSKKALSQKVTVVAG